MIRSIRALVTVFPLALPEMVEVQAHLLNAANRMNGEGVIFSPEAWSVWRRRLAASKVDLDTVESHLKLGGVASLGVCVIRLPTNPSGQVILLEASRRS